MTSVVPGILESLLPGIQHFSFISVPQPLAPYPLRSEELPWVLDWGQSISALFKSLSNHTVVSFVARECSLPPRDVCGMMGIFPAKITSLLFICPCGMCKPPGYTPSPGSLVMLMEDL